jgi:hypothetical protein
MAAKIPAKKPAPAPPMGTGPAKGSYFWKIDQGLLVNPALVAESYAVVRNSAGLIIAYERFGGAAPPPPAYISAASLSVAVTEPSGVVLDPITWVSATGGPDLNGRTTDDQQSEWAVPTGAFQQGGYEGGAAWPTTPGTRSVALVSGAANGQVGVTFRSSTLSTGTHTQGLVFRYSDDSDYWSANRTQLKKKVAGAWTVLATYAVPFADNDRIVVSMNGSTINVFRNAGTVAVATVTDSFNASAILHGIEAT